MPYNDEISVSYFSQQLTKRSQQKFSEMGKPT